MIIFPANHPLVRNGTYDQEGYKPGERARIEKARAHQQQLDAQQTQKCSRAHQRRAMLSKRRRPK